MRRTGEVVLAGIAGLFFIGCGKSTKATVGAPFDGTPIGKCVVRAFVNIIVTPFEGPDVDVHQKVPLR